MYQLRATKLSNTLVIILHRKQGPIVLSLLILIKKSKKLKFIRIQTGKTQQFPNKCPKLLLNNSFEMTLQIRRPLTQASFCHLHFHLIFVISFKQPCSKGLSSPPPLLSTKHSEKGMKRREILGIMLINTASYQQLVLKFL